MDVAQLIWFSGFPSKGIFNAKNALLGHRGQSYVPLGIFRPSYGPLLGFFFLQDIIVLSRLKKRGILKTQTYLEKYRCIHF